MSGTDRPVEQALRWDCEGQSQLGILSQPATPASDLGVLVIVGGPQYRAGSHRQFTLLCRRLAREGFPALRFDVRGMGDSEGELRNFEHLDADIAAALAALQRHAPSVRRVVLWGLCDAASAALLYLAAIQDARVAGLVLLNPWVRSAQSLAQTQVKHYYRQRLRDPAFWRKLLAGGVALAALREYLSNLVRSRARPAGSAMATLGFQERMAVGWAQGPRAPLLVLSGDDYTAKEFTEYAADSERWQQAMRSNPPLRLEVAGANHTFASAAWCEDIAVSTLECLRRIGQAA